MPAKAKPIKAYNSKLNLTFYFRKAKDASKYLGCDASIIAKVCKGKLNSSWGWRFTYLEQEVYDQVKYVSESDLEKLPKFEKKKVPWNRGKSNIYSKSTLDKMRKSKVGTVCSDETKRKMSKSRKEYYKHNKHHALGTKLTEKHKINISKGLKNIPEIEKVRLKKLWSKKSKEYWSKLSKSELNEFRNSQRLKSTKTTYGQVRLVLEDLGFIPLFKLKADDKFLDIDKKQDIKCSCGNVWKVYLNEVVRGKIKSCGCKKSAPELEIYEFLINELGLSSEDIIKNARPDFMDGKELDLFIPKLNTAIEHHGLAFHSKRPYFNGNSRGIRSLHKRKFLACEEAGIKLIQIFEDEWLEHRDIVKSILRNKLQKTKNRIFARKTEVRELSTRLCRTFFDNNHIAGYTYAPIALGLYYENELVCAISFRKPYTKKYKGYIEIARFASKLNTQVVGGFQKLLKHSIKILKNQGYGAILTYADLRFGTGEVYKNSGFDYIGRTAPNYFYEKGSKREGRLEHRKNNDPDFIKKYGNTEKEQNNNRGWYAIYDAGSEIYLKKLT